MTPLRQTSSDGDGTVRVLAVLEATRLTGVARNVVQFGCFAAHGSSVALSAALIRRDGVLAAGCDPVQAAADGAGIPAAILAERHRYDTSVIDQLARVAARIRPHVIETHHVKSHCLLALSGLWRQCAWVAFHHGYTRTDLKVRAYNQVDRWSLRFAAHVVTMNLAAASELSRWRGVRPDRLTILHNGVHPMHASPAAVAAMRRLLHLAPGERVILTVGRLSHEKGQEGLLRAFARCAVLHRRVRLVVAGDGAEAERLARIAAGLGIARRVTFAGYVADVAPLYALADLFVLPSLSEGSPNALLEAMAFGLPVVATRVGGVPEIACDEATARLVPPRDEAAMAAAIEQVLRDRSYAAGLAAAARREVLARYTPERRAGALENLYRRLASDRLSSGSDPRRVARPATEISSHAW